MRSRFFNILMGLLALGVIGYSVYGARAAQLMVPSKTILTSLITLSFLLLLACYSHWRKGPRLVDLCLAAFWSLALQGLYPVPMYIAARNHVPLQDALLARLDHALGIEVPTVLHAVNCWPPLKKVLACAYASLVILMALGLILPTLLGQSRVVKEYLVAVAVSAIISIPCFGIFQAIGPWHHYGYAADAEQARTMKVFLDLKSQGWFTLDGQHMVGLIAFPSFHTILALLAAFALWQVKYVRWLGAVWAMLVVLSTLTTGWHYIADVLGGMALTVVALLAARGYTVLEVKWASASTPPAPRSLPSTTQAAAVPAPLAPRATAPVSVTN